MLVAGRVFASLGDSGKRVLTRSLNCISASAMLVHRRHAQDPPSSTQQKPRGMRWGREGDGCGRKGVGVGRKGAGVICDSKGSRGSLERVQTKSEAR